MLLMAVRPRFPFAAVENALNPFAVEKGMLVVNGQAPGPLIEANQGELAQHSASSFLTSSPPGDTLVIKVNNHLPHGTTIHWLVRPPSLRSVPT